MKGPNISLKKNMLENIHIPKIIDFGTGVTHFNEILAISPFYFYNGYSRTE